jgi:hypothetical protein
MALRGANNPKLANVIVSQNRRIARNGNETDARCWWSQSTWTVIGFREVQRPGLERPLGVAVGFRFRMRARFLTSRQRIETDRLGGILRPNISIRPPTTRFNSLRIPRFRTVASKVRGREREFEWRMLSPQCSRCQGTFGGGSDQSKNQGGHCSDESDATSLCLSTQRRNNVLAIPCATAFRALQPRMWILKTIHADYISIHNSNSDCVAQAQLSI